MDEERRKTLIAEWLERRITEQHIMSMGRDFAEKLMRMTDEPQAKERGMTLEQFHEYEFEQYCRDKLAETQHAREEHASSLLREGHTKEALYMFEALLAEGYTTAHFPMNLAKIYRKLKRLDDEIRVLERGIFAAENVWKDRHPLDQCTNLKNVRVGLLKERLDKARFWKAKADARQGR